MSDTPSTQAAENPSGQRDARGRCLAGNQPGPGPANPFARRSARLRSAFMDCVQDKDVVAIAQALIEKAKKGDVPAAKLVLTYTLGKPAEAVSPDRLAIDEWQIFRATAPMFAEMPTLIKAPAPDLALDLTREMRPIVTEAMRHQVGKMLKDQAKALKGDAKTPSTNRHRGEKRRRRPSANGDKRRRLDGAAPSANGK